MAPSGLLCLGRPLRSSLTCREKGFTLTTRSVSLPYASPVEGLCPLCTQRPPLKSLYGRQVCKKCYYRFANRRQFAYLIDALLFVIPTALFTYFINDQLIAMSSDEGMHQLLLTILSVAAQCVFAMKDGFNGQSPGKRITGIQVVDATTQKPISFGLSFKRNAVFLLGVIPFIGGLLSLIVLITIIIQMSKGARLGDRFAGTKVIWKRYADSPVFGGNDQRCRKCHYDLTGNQSGLCPECGTPVPVPVAAYG